MSGASPVSTVRLKLIFELSRGTYYVAYIKNLQYRGFVQVILMSF